jgi:transposase
VICPLDKSGGGSCLDGVQPVDPGRGSGADDELQDVLLKAMAKRISWLSAAEIIGVTPRTMRRWRERMEEQGYDGLRDRRKGKTSQRRVALETCEAVLRLYQEKYFDLNVRHFHEKLKEVEGIELSYTWVKQALQGAGLVARKRRRSPHRRRRPRWQTVEVAAFHCLMSAIIGRHFGSGLRFSLTPFQASQSDTCTQYRL